MKKKKWTALCLTLALCLCFSFAAMAASEGAAADGAITGSFSVDGSRVVVQINLAEGTDVTYGKVAVNYDSELYTLAEEETQLGDVSLAADVHGLNTGIEGTVSVAWAALDPSEAGGALMTVVLQAAEGVDPTSDTAGVWVVVSGLGDSSGEDIVEEGTQQEFELAYEEPVEPEEPAEGSGETEEPDEGSGAAGGVSDEGAGDAAESDGGSGENTGDAAESGEGSGEEAETTAETSGAGTGDYSHALIVSAAALVALAALAVVAIRRRA